MKEHVLDKDNVFTVTGRILGRLEEIRDYSSGKAALANLRNSIGRPLSETIDVWPIVFEQMPEHFLSKNGKLTSEEKAILTTLQIYALHQQGQSVNVNKRSEKEKWNNIGISLKALRNGEDTIAIDSRFNTMITSTTFEELIHHLRQLVRILKAKKQNEKIVYARLANDLYWYLRNQEENVRLSWAKAYYSKLENTEKGDVSND
ncbi:type I-E CRISPR-associated protein Cse2/CasB [Proteinivorax hydrogeniformans]|uniref:Type I-E CRISPR-associated protein Cse2/CasB n=1 Tax=Proteinivorax hydrogeniformans TaxID=1826727 RepID=A0AAU8HVB5_9FIRM